ncbi:hypothetical protein [Guptibacillus algicola]|uniref:hypothetical protein n=1 Tax=Guptibacillus algicola TaxID=225844 RepID=UPI001CD559CD|nr:hypothetical protein [Alkalihalobacillus algicola]MCA0988167.1 hypothetical protein [Alkalihalobacillus algicola]
MDRKDFLGSEIYKMFDASGPPYGCGTAALIGGFASRLAIMTLTISDIDHELGDVPRTYFLLCDEDDVQFEEFLENGSARTLNDVPMRLLECTYHLMLELSQHEKNIKQNVVVDYRMAMRMLRQVFEAAENILLSNGCSAEMRKEMLSYENSLYGTLPKSLQN